MPKWLKNTGGPWKGNASLLRVCQRTLNPAIRINRSSHTPSVGGEIVRATIFAAMVASKTFRRALGTIGAAVMTFVGLEMVYSSLVDPQWQGVGGNAVYSFLAFLAGAFLVGVYFLAAMQ